MSYKSNCQPLANGYVGSKQSLMLLLFMLLLSKQKSHNHVYVTPPFFSTATFLKSCDIFFVHSYETCFVIY